LDPTPAPKEGGDMKGLKSHHATNEAEEEEEPEGIETKSQEELPMQEDDEKNDQEPPISPRFHHSAPRLNWAETRTFVKNDATLNQRAKLDIDKTKKIKDNRKKAKKSKLSRIRRAGFTTGLLTAEDERVLERQDEEVDLGEYL
jgi:hypothetical protein